jgi:hypothetical protein
MGPASSLDATEKRKHYFPSRKSNTGRPVLNLVAISTELPLLCPKECTLGVLYSLTNPSLKLSSQSSFVQDFLYMEYSSFTSKSDYNER